MQDLWLWVKQIVGIACLAAIFDLVLPTSELQRYAKFVMRILLFLCLLQPLRSVLALDFSVANVFPSTNTYSTGSPELQSILAEGKQMRTEREQQSLQVTVDAIERQLTTDIADTFKRQVRRVRVTLDTSKQHAPQLAAIDVWVRASARRRESIAVWLRQRYGQAQTQIQVRDSNDELLPTTAPKI